MTSRDEEGAILRTKVSVGSFNSSLGHEVKMQRHASLTWISVSGVKTCFLQPVEGPPGNMFFYLALMLGFSLEGGLSSLPRGPEHHPGEEQGQHSRQLLKDLHEAPSGQS